MKNNTVNTENSVEFQEYRNAVLNGIAWSKKVNNETGAELYIGQVNDYQIYLSESPNLRDTNQNIGTYTMSLWEVGVKTKTTSTDDIPELLITRPGFVQLISDAVFQAGDIDEAKMEAVHQIIQWDGMRFSEAVKAHDKLFNVFGNLNSVLSDRIKAEKAADSIKTLRIQTGTANKLIANNIHVIGELTKLSKKDLKELKGLGEKGVQEILFALKAIGIIMRAQ